MGAGHETEVVISPTIKSELGKFILAYPVCLCTDRRAAGDRANLERIEDAMRRYVQEAPKNAVLVETMREEELVANFEQVRAKTCATSGAGLKVLARKPCR